MGYVGLCGHYFSAEASGGAAFALIVGTWLIIMSAWIVFCLIPFVLYEFAFRSCYAGASTGTELARSWEVVRIIFLELPGLLITLLGNPVGAVGWSIELLDSGVDYMLERW